MKWDWIALRSVFASIHQLVSSPSLMLPGPEANSSAQCDDDQKVMQPSSGPRTHDPEQRNDRRPHHVTPLIQPWVPAPLPLPFRDFCERTNERDALRQASSASLRQRRMRTGTDCCCCDVVLDANAVRLSMMDYYCMISCVLIEQDILRDRRAICQLDAESPLGILVHDP